jgi:two-component system LytT family response regulator
VFLDVQMPGMDGFEVLRTLPTQNLPAVIFVTAHDQYALRTFSIHAMDYLLKPIEDSRFA